ncbi:MAG: TetR/AcrR family transcriptional regulator [Muribaculaceae bacterium]|nr:TetR/AcrR family transcriptional regulator [Muribaculaceae bacterium]
MTKESDKSILNDTETRILQAAEHEFLSKGLAGARTTAIAEAAGVTHAMLHYYFRTKEKLFDRIITAKMDALKMMIMKSLEDIDLPLEDMIGKLIDLHLDFIANNPELPRFLICDVFNDTGRFSALIAKIKEFAPIILSRLQAKIDESAAQGKCRQLDARMLLLDILSLNVFPFLARPLVDTVLDGLMDRKDFLVLKKEENYDTVMRKLKP